MGAHAAACELITILERRGGGGRAVLELMRVVQNGSGCGKVPPVCSSALPDLICLQPTLISRIKPASNIQISAFFCPPPLSLAL
ncbi:hypothetical protein V6N12_055725 [Hibiscus sabdariffa]|uniref:Uncharacterized protein n=1 Tax=Hibiscus sabdariffa TaxID=183260 RepID=A0ABR2AUQ3_9ROSI